MGRGRTGVRAASESSIEIAFTHQGVRCRERLKLKPTTANLKRAELHRAAILDAILCGSFDYATTFPDSPNAARFSAPKQRVTVRNFLEDWLDKKEPQLKSSSHDGYRKIITYQINPSLGSLFLDELSRRHIKDWLHDMTAGNKRLRNIQSCLRTALDDAVMDELIEQNPITNWTYQKKDAPKPEDDVDPFDAEEQQAILAVLPEQSKNLIQFAFWTGLRTSELVALNWADIDWIKGYVRVSKAITQTAKTAETPKTKAGIRDVKLLKPALDALKRQKAFTYLASEEVFQNPRTESRWEGDAPIRKTLWIPALKKAGVRYRRPYQTRHTYASMMLSAGEHPMWVAQQIGHRDWTMIGRIYGRWIPSADTEAGSRAESKFSSNDSIMTTNKAKPL